MLLRDAGIFVRDGTKGVLCSCQRVVSEAHRVDVS